MKKSEFKKNCPECNRIQSYNGKYLLAGAIKNNTKCMPCAKSDKNNGFYGKFHSEESKQKMSNAHEQLSDETKQKMSVSHKGLKHSKETKQKIREGNLGRVITDETRQKMCKNHANVSGKNNPFYGKRHTEETKQKLRLLRIKQIEARHGIIFPNYNPKACMLFNWANMYYDLHIQHAENGGEFYLKEAGYYADGYIKEINTWIEYYEMAHKRTIEHDKQRKQNIIAHLGCKFIEIKEWEY